MANLVRNFIKGRMNKSVDERLVPQGEYIDAQNIRMGSTEDSEIGAVENTKGNTQLTTLLYPPTGTALSDSATCIGAYADGANETMYWFVHDDLFGDVIIGARPLDLIVSYNTRTDLLTYHVVSVSPTVGGSTTLNFNPRRLITGVDLVDDLLFFTDDYNPPRRINVTTAYPQPVNYVDDPELGERIMVLKGAPLAAPSLALVDADNSQNNYMEERFICFAYRYRYEEREYSATSQFTGPAFSAGPFFFAPESLTNEGMENRINSAVVTINTGGNLVKGFDLLFKEMDDNIVRVIERFDKEQDGIPDDSTFTYEFDNSKIFTILPESEILRLYDNVPRLAQAQTMMGNRLVYGNYLEGYDLIERPGVPIRLNYFVTHIKEELGATSVSSEVSNATTYLLDGQGLTPNLTMEITITDFQNVELGDTFEITVEVSHESWTTVSGTSPTSTTPESTVVWRYVVDADYNTLADMCTSPGFSNSLGTTTNIETDPALYASSDQSIFTNAWNNIFPLTATGGTPDPQNLVGTGVNQIGDSILGTVVTDDTFRLLFPIPKYTSGGTDSYESVGIGDFSVNYYAVGSQRSLHSNRSYEVGIVYMDAYGRSSTALVSDRNQIHIPCSDSVFRNQARVQIPYWNPAPYWAERYKFVIKPDREGYETIYTKIFFEFAGNKYFLLEGEQAAKVEKGDRYVIKSDAGGAISSCEYITVLEKSAIAKGELSEAETVPAVAGTYMSVLSSETDINVNSGSPFYDSGFEKKCQGPLGGLLIGLAHIPNVSIDDIPTYAIGAGSRITIIIEATRNGTGDGNNACESRYVQIEESFIATNNYTDFTDWFYGDPDVKASLENNILEGGDDQEYPVIVQDEMSAGVPFQEIADADTLQDASVFIRINTTDGGLKFQVKGTGSCSGGTGLGLTDNRKSCIKARVQISPANETLVFETEPQDALPDLWYESSESYGIVYDAVTENRYHQGNLQNQSATQNAIIDTGFFNCITYGNGVESYKIRDSISGKPITLGNRVTTVSEQDYKEIRRFADLTYSGVYNDETNLNKLNEFNLGLLNFKPLEDSYGPVAKLFGRRTDILTLQEDKISYVLAGKNLLTDSTGESVVASVPQVLGTQVARVEEFGISNNPESFAEWGPHKFFTDAKRGAVIHLYGDGQKEQLEVISENGMRSWFRDEFIAGFNTQKLGGYDPYMNEYVLASNDTLLPGVSSCIDCGTSQTFTLTIETQNYCVNLGSTTGDVVINYSIVSRDPDTRAVIFYTLGSTSGFTIVPLGVEPEPTSVTISKDSVTENILSIGVVATPTPDFVLQVTVDCPDSDEVAVKLVTLTRPSQAGQLIHNEYRWEDGVFNSPLHSQQIKFAVGSTTPVVSQFTEFSGPQGGGIIPTDNADVEMRYNRFGDDNYVLNPSDRFYYLRTDIDYANTPVDIAALRSAALPATGIVPAGGPALYTGNFAMPTTGAFLYLIWDYSSALPTALCFDATDGKVGACCECVCDTLNCQQYDVYNADNENITVQYTECGGATAYITIAGKRTVSLCSDTYPVAVAGETGYMQVTITNCEC